MALKIDIADDVLQNFPDLKVFSCIVKNIGISEVDSGLEDFKEQVYDDVRRRFVLEALKDEPVFKAYRNFFWRLGIDPTKIRPAAEALIRRILGGKPLPRINTAVDAYNLASMTTCIALAAFDISRLDGELAMRFANRGETFLGIGMSKPVILGGGEIVMVDASRLVAIYPYRDADYSRITLQTKELILISCGVPGIPQDQLREACERAVKFIAIFCDGEVEDSE